MIFTPFARLWATDNLRSFSALRYQRDPAQLRPTLVGGPGLTMQLQGAGINIFLKIPADVYVFLT
jgi:hypothetical protein